MSTRVWIRRPSRKLDGSSHSPALAAVAFIIFEDSLGITGSFIASLAIAAAIGWVNAQLVLRARLVSMIVTLSGLFFYRGVIYVWTGGTADSLSSEGREHWLTLTFGGNLFGFENAVLWLLVLVIAGQLALTRARFGNQLLAVGGDEPSVHSRGVDVRKVKTVAFVACSTLAGLAGIVTICDQPQTHVTLGALMELEAIAAAVVGGCLLIGGRGSLIGAALGAFIITSVRFELIGLGAPSSWFITFVGLLLIVAVVANQWISDRLAIELGTKPSSRPSACARTCRSRATSTSAASRRRRSPGFRFSISRRCAKTAAR